jgi:isopentenyl-diphosphate Delta-isomerase
MISDLWMLVDAVDEANRPIGKAIRGDVLLDGVNFRTVHVLLRDAERRLILQRLPETHPRSPGQLGSSVAGYLRSGESYEAAAHRKLQEELGVDADLAYIDSISMKDRNSKKFIGVFVGDIDRAPRYDREQVAELVSLTLPELSIRVATTPTDFTATFIHVFGHIRQQLVTTGRGAGAAGTSA